MPAPQPAVKDVRYQQVALVAGALTAAAAHLPLVASHLRDAPYMGVLFIGFSLSCVVAAALVLRRPSTAALLFAGGLCASAIVTYVATRLVAFPSLADDVGSWWEPLGVVSVLSEAVVVVAAARMGHLLRAPQRS